MAGTNFGQKGPGPWAFALSLSLAAVVGLGASFALAQWLAPPPSTVENPAPAPDSLLPRLQAPLNVLFLATDVNYTVRDGHRAMGLTGNTDTLILARLDPRADQVRMLSIPRDTRVPIPGHGTFKVNAANPYGGPKLACRVVSDFLNVPVDRYVLINTRAVVQLVDALGGVEVFVPKDLRYDDRAGGLHIALSRGWNHLDGQRSHDFLRFRHDDLGDIGRVQRQQAFLQAFMAQYLTPKSILKTPELLGVARENLQTNLSGGELLAIAAWGKNLDSDKVQMTMVPGLEAIVHGGWYWVASQEGTERVVRRFMSGEQSETALSPARYRIAVQDGVGDARQARRLLGELERAGYGRVELVGSAPRQGMAHTLIIAQSADVAGARALAECLGVGKVEVASTGSLRADFTVVMGRDWTNR